MSVIKQWFDIKPIEIQTPNGTQTVSRIHFNGYEPTLHLIFENNHGEIYELDCTFNHPLRTSDGTWVEAEYIEPHHTFDGNYVLTSSMVNSKEIATFDFEVPEEHCYILESGIVSHNTASIMGGISESISPEPALSYTAQTAAGDIDRINPVLLKLMKERGVYDKKHVSEIAMHQGSVQFADWLTPEEKDVFKTAFEINQKVIIRMASARARYIDQWQSLNLFFAADESPEWIAEVHQEAFEDTNILALYYIYTQAGVQASKGECEACQ